MAIIHMGDNVNYIPIKVGGVWTADVKSLNEDQPEGAYCALDWDNSRDGGFRNIHALVLYSTHHGRCLFERERNMHDDSDFYMTVWEGGENGFAREIQFATTRGWSYPCYGSSVDATPEVMAWYEAWRAEQYRRSDVRAKWNARKHDRLMREQLKVTAEGYNRLCRAYIGETRSRVFKLLTSKLRSGFRIKMANQVREWLADPNPKYPTPLSRKQVEYV